MPYLICQYMPCSTSFYVKPSHLTTKPNRYHSLACQRLAFAEQVAARTEKVCPQCHIRKPLDAYHISTTRPDGHQSTCKDCINTRDKCERRKRGLILPQHPHLNIDPQTGRFVSVVPLIERFWSYVSRSDDPDACWSWTGALDTKGYGTITVRRVEDLPEGFEHKSSDLYFAHRLSYAMFVGPIPVGLDVLHTCDNPPCVKPAHLYPGTHQDNMADRQRKGRDAYGQRNGNTHLTDELVKEILSLKGQYSSLTIAPWYHVSSTTILNIWNKKTFKRIHENIQ